MKIQLGTPLDKCNLCGSEKIAITRKLNGCRCVWTDGKLLTRTGREYTGLNHIQNAIIEAGLSDMFLDGELIYKNYEGLSDSAAFQKGNGIANSKADSKPELKFVIFDCLQNGGFNADYTHRRAMLDLIGERIKAADIPDIEILPLLYSGQDHKEIQNWLDFAENNDWEGIMINLDVPYKFGRTKDLIKVKRFKSCDILCTDLMEGTGRNAGRLGALICSYKGNAVRVGAGFSDENRDFYWKNPAEIKGRIVSVQYKEETHNKKGGISIQFPVFECVRCDKTMASYN